MAFNKKWMLNKVVASVDLGDIKEADEKRWNRTLIGKLQTKRWFEGDDIKKELVRNWCIRSKFEFTIVADGICTVTFKKEIDYLFVLENGPWDIRGYIISFKPWPKDINLEEFDFPFFPMWIQIFGLPLERHGAANVWKIGAILGEVLMVDPVGGAEGRLPYVRVQVIFNIHRPIIKEAEATLTTSKITRVTFKYERLPVFCYFCGLIGHDHGVCKEFRECQRKFHREITREELRRILNFSHIQKAKTFKFGAGIQVKHTIEVDTEAEIEFEDKRVKEWQSERLKEEERKNKELTQSDLRSQSWLTKKGTSGISRENIINPGITAVEFNQNEGEKVGGGLELGVMVGSSQFLEEELGRIKRYIGENIGWSQRPDALMGGGEWFVWN